MPDPFIKWAGGKRQMIDLLRPMVVDRLAEGGTYWEPFLGGGALALSLDADVPVVASDACAELIEAWDRVRGDTFNLARILARHAEAHADERYYYEVRESEATTPVGRAARFIYLNKTGFNGLYRVNKAGKFNVPRGRGKSSSIPRYSDLVEVGERLRRSWRLECVDFEDLLEDRAHRPTEGDVVFADPPYDGTHDYSSGFSWDDQRRLAAALRRAARRGVAVIATNADTPRIRREYRWAIVTSVAERRRISCDSAHRGDASCVVVTR